MSVPDGAWGLEWGLMTLTAAPLAVGLPLAVHEAEVLNSLANIFMAKSLFPIVLCLMGPLRDQSQPSLGGLCSL